MSLLHENVELADYGILCVNDFLDTKELLVVFYLVLYVNPKGLTMPGL